MLRKIFPKSTVYNLFKDPGESVRAKQECKKYSYVIIKRWALSCKQHHWKDNPAGHRKKEAEKKMQKQIFFCFLLSKVQKDSKRLRFMQPTKPVQIILNSSQFRWGQKCTIKAIHSVFAAWKSLLLFAVHFWNPVMNGRIVVCSPIGPNNNLAWYRTKTEIECETWPERERESEREAIMRTFTKGALCANPVRPSVQPTPDPGQTTGKQLQTGMQKKNELKTVVKC